MKKLIALALFICVTAALSHETLTTTVLFDREIVRILDRRCVMCHVENGPSFPLVTYEETWLKGRSIRAAILGRHMPPWGAVPGYGDFVNDNGLTLRETQFIVSWVEGLGPRNAGTVFANIADPSAKPRQPARAHIDFGHWQLGEPSLKLQLPGISIAAGEDNGVKSTIVDLGSSSERRVAAVEYIPGERRVVRAAFFTVKETGQWIGSWTPWHGFMTLPAASAFRLPAGSHIVAEIHYRATKEPTNEQGTLGLFFAQGAVRNTVTDLVLDGKPVRLASDTHVLALRPQLSPGLKSIEVSARKPDGGTEILLFAKDPPQDWPTPYIFKNPVLLRRGTVLSVRSRPERIRLTVSRY